MVLYQVQDGSKEWFNCIDKFDENTKGVWDKYGKILMNWTKKWKDESAVETQLERKCSASSVGQRKGIKKPIRIFVEAADECLGHVVNGSFFGAQNECKKEMIKSLASTWFEACNACYRGKDVAAWIKRKEKDAAAYEVIAFGPWLVWSEDG